MTKEELKARVNYKPIKITDLGDLKRDTRMTPYTYQSTTYTFVGHYVNGRLIGAKNVLAKKNDAAAMAMCKDSK